MSNFMNARRYKISGSWIRIVFSTHGDDIAGVRAKSQKQEPPWVADGAEKGRTGAQENTGESCSGKVR